MGGTENSPSGELNHAIMFKAFNDAINAFIYDMTQLGHINRIMICSTSEFHRTMRENGNEGADHGQSSHAYAWGPGVTSDLYGAPLDYRQVTETNALTYADPGVWTSPFPNRLLNHTMDYRDFQRLQCEWLTERVLTNEEVAEIWGGSFVSSMTTAQRAGIVAT